MACTMNVLIRTDSSVSIGSGHLMRCLTLANQLREKGAAITFVCRDLPGAMHDVVRKNGYTLFIIPSVNEVSASQREDANATANILAAAFPEGCDLIVVDHYQLDASWETIMRAHTKHIMVIDDLANRPHDCDFLLDQNYYINPGERYRGLIPDNCIRMLGPNYVLLRREFIEARQGLQSRGGEVKRILVFFGASDSDSQTEKVIEAIRQLSHPKIEADVVIGQANPNRVRLQSLCDTMQGVNLHCQVSNMAELISRADLGIGAGGAAMWERCYLGLPTITVVFADNQYETTRDVAQLGAIDFLGWSQAFSAEDYVRAIIAMLEYPQKVKQIADNALSVVPLSASRVAEVVYEHCANGCREGFIFNSTVA